MVEDGRGNGAGLKPYGHVVLRVYIDPSTFPDWCAAHGTSPGRDGRKKFVAAAVADRSGDHTGTRRWRSSLVARSKRSALRRVGRRRLWRFLYGGAVQCASLIAPY